VRNQQCSLCISTKDNSLPPECFSTNLRKHERRVSSVGIATGSGFEGWGSIPGRGKRYSLSVQTGSEATQAPVKCVLGCFSGVKRLGHEADRSQLVPRSRMVELHLHSLIRFYGLMLN
jgi:hypothetical protein